MCTLCESTLHWQINIDNNRDCDADSTSGNSGKYARHKKLTCDLDLGKLRYKAFLIKATSATVYCSKMDRGHYWSLA